MGGVSGGSAKERGTSTAGDWKPPIPTPEETGVANVSRNTEALIEPTVASNIALTELPMKMDESLLKQTESLGTYMQTICDKMGEVLAAMTRDSEVVKIDSAQLPLAVTGNFGGGVEKVASNG